MQPINQRETDPARLQVEIIELLGLIINYLGSDETILKKEA
jgi:hypothetical protein